MEMHVMPETALPGRPPILVEEIIQSTAGYFGLEKEEMLAKKRKRHVCMPRQTAMYLSREILILPGWRSYPQVARCFDTDHSTVIHGARAIETRLVCSYDKPVTLNRLQEDALIREAVRDLSAHIEGVVTEARLVAEKAKEEGRDVSQIAYIESNRELIAKSKPVTPVGFFEAPPIKPQHVRHIPIEDVRDLVAEYYQIDLKAGEEPRNDDELFCSHVVGYLIGRVNRKHRETMRVMDGNKPYRLTPTEFAGYEYIKLQAVRDADVWNDIERLWNNVLTPDVAPRVR